MGPRTGTAMAMGIDRNDIEASQAANWQVEGVVMIALGRAIVIGSRGVVRFGFHSTGQAG